MDELIRLVAQKTGLAEDKARIAVETVLSFIKDRLPAPISSQIDGIFSGKGVAGGLGGMFGSK